MAQLVKMSLLGVRSFDPEKQQWIKFHPLTLILGVNGAGKTTIIEALRYVTSGEFPPGSNAGKLWIHDPLLQKSGGKVRAQVKLQFRTSDGVATTITRSLEMITKKSSGKSGGVTQQLKTLDSHIKRDQSSVGSRCLDMTKEMLSLLNVSKAVLTNVVFCHQEDNCWPLSEGKVLKEKFDQIFGSIHYVKSLAKIKKTREEQVKCLKILQAHKETFDEIAGTKAKYTKRKKDLEKIVENLRREKTDLEDKLGPIDGEIIEITRKESELNQVISEMSKIQGRLKEKEEQHVRLKTTLGSFPEKTVEEVNKKKAQFIKSTREQAEGLKNVTNEIAKIDDEIKRANSEITSAENRKGTLQFQLEQNAKNSKKREKAIATARSILPTPCDSDDVDVLKKLLEKELQKISSEEDESDPQLVELEAKLRKHETEKKVILKEIEMKQKDQAKRDMELSHLTAELTKIESPAAEILKDTNLISEELQPIRDKVDECELFEPIDSILERIRLNHFDLDEAITNLKRSYKQMAKDSISSISDLRKKQRIEEEQVKKAKNELERLNAEKAAKRSETRSRTSTITSAINGLASCSGDYTPTSDIDAELSVIDEEQEKCRQKINKLKEERTSLEKQKVNSERKSAGHQLAMRDFTDKIQFLHLTSEIASLTESLNEMKKQHGVVDVSALQKKKKELNDRRLKIANEVGSIKGKIDQIYTELKSVEGELRLKKFQTIENDLKKATIDVVTTDLLCKDLNTYYKVLDKAITTFHLRQMESINQLIAHYWHITYQGGDIETVRIACDEEGDRTAEAKRRNYNYRVVMMKNGIEFDMRGRCSAGQKVLASLVIRIALAQIFCKNCSILTLDEPTTNLDKHNIEFLAKAIHGIVEDQKGKLQIVIITHDEEFLKYIDGDYCDEYFEIVKEDGYSHVISRKLAMRE